MALPSDACVALLLFAGLANAYPVGPAVSLEKMTADADIVFKGTAGRGGVAQDDWFAPYAGFRVAETHFRVISVLKGQNPGGTLMFRHYARDPRPGGVSFSQPQHYEFREGSTYIVFAKSAGQANVFRQLWVAHTLKADQGVIRCGSGAPARGGTVKDALWNELTTMLGGSDAGDAVYAIEQLDSMSGRPYAIGGLTDFDRNAVMTAVHHAMSSQEPRIAQAAINLMGSGNPYMDDDRAIFWLATVADTPVPGIGKLDPNMKNPGGALYWKELITAAGGRAPDAVRAAAIRAMGLVRDPAIELRIRDWLADTSPRVRASAAVLLADYPGEEMRRQLRAAHADPAAEVRIAVARAVGFGRQLELIDVLDRLLRDNDSKVGLAAARSLLSFSPRNEAVAATLRANLDYEAFQPVFLNALARENPKPYLDRLATAVDRNISPRAGWDGQIPPFTSWEILFSYLQQQPAADARSGVLDRYLAALERAVFHSSSEPRDLYAFYLQRGMAERARSFRGKVAESVPYNLDYYFDQVDANPGRYTRQ